MAPGRYVLKAGLKLAGGAVEWLARQLSGPGKLPYAEPEALAREGVGLRAGPLWLPHRLGSGTPEGGRHGQAALAGVRPEHGRGDLLRGLPEGLAFWLRRNLEEMQALAGLGAGAFASPAEAVASLRCPRAVTAPGPALAAWYGRLYEEAYRPLYGALSGVRHALARLSSEGRARF